MSGFVSLSLLKNTNSFSLVFQCMFIELIKTARCIERNTWLILFYFGSDKRVESILKPREKSLACPSYILFYTYAYRNACTHRYFYFFLIFFYGYLPDLQPSHVNASQLVHLIVSAYNGRQIFLPSVLQHERKLS